MSHLTVDAIKDDNSGLPMGTAVPLGIFALFILNSAGLLPVMQFQGGYTVALASVFSETGNILLALAMAAMGLEVNLKMFVKIGGRALVVGALACAIACLVSWALIRGLL